MPNPFVKLPHNRGLTPEERVQPVPDTVAEIGDNIPYLGDVDHGVKGLHDFNTALVPDDTVRKVEYAKDDDMVPIPVRIVASDDHSEIRKMFRTNSFPVPALGSPPLRIASRNDHRTKLTLVNTDPTTPIYVSDLPDHTGFASFVVQPKERIEFSHTGEVYVLSTAAANVNQGGWINLVPRQIYNGTTGKFGNPVNVRGYTTGRVLMRVYSLSGTTTTIVGSVMPQDWAGITTTGGASVGATAAVTTVATAHAQLNNPLNTDSVVGLISPAGSSGDSVIDAEMWAYFTPNNSGASATPTVSVLQEFFVELD